MEQGVGSGRWRGRLAAVVTVAMVVVAGCSGDDDGAKSDASARKQAVSTEKKATDAAAATPSAGCRGAATAVTSLAEEKMPIRGVSRRFLLSAPAWKRGDTPLPLVVDFHGLAEGADVHAQMTQLAPQGNEEGFVTVQPHGTGTPVAWNVTPDVRKNADLEFVNAFLDRVERERCIDTSRVYATGLSNGAMMTSTVACALSDRFAAVAPVSGAMFPDGCKPTHPMPILVFHGTADPILSFNGGVNGAGLGAALGGGGQPATTTTVAVDIDGEGYPATVRQWAAFDGCQAKPHDVAVGKEVVRRSYDCPADAPVVFYIVEGGGHAWPGSQFSKAIERIVGHTTFDINASTEIWKFVKRFHLPKR
jgi:polyhydroxybutyrate depolymerase